jgi:hypothetical protein
MYNGTDVAAISGTIVKLITNIEINDSTVTITDIKSEKSRLYKIITKSLNGDSYKLSDGVREAVLDIIYYEKPPMKIKGKFYHYWITLSVDKLRLSYFGELMPRKD